MKNIMIVILIIAEIFLFMTKEDAVQNTYTDTAEPPKKTELNTPTNTYKRQVEALSISNTLQNPINTYLDSHCWKEYMKKTIEKNIRKQSIQTIKMATTSTTSTIQVMNTVWIECMMIIKNIKSTASTKNMKDNFSCFQI